MSDIYQGAGRDGEDVTRITHGRVADDPSPPAVRVVGGATQAQYSREGRRTADSGEVHGDARPMNLGGHFRYNAASPEKVQGESVGRYQAGDTAQDGDILSTARRSSGAPIPPSRMDAKSIVRWQGMDMAVEIAMGLGAPIERDPQGGYRTKGAAPFPSPAPSSPAQETSGEAEALPDEFGLEPGEVDAHAAIAKAIRAPILEAIVESAITEGADALYRGAATALEHAGLTERAESVAIGLQREADKAVTRLGVEDPWAFYSWAHANARSDLQTAMREHYASGDARKYGPLVGRFKRARG